jgi:hypothetical protein
MIDINQFAELELRVNDLQNALARVIEERDNYKDTADSLFRELESCRAHSPKPTQTSPAYAST